MTMSDLVLESMGGKGDEKGVKVILPNIKGQRYALGSFYPGESGGEEFIVTRNDEDLPDLAYGAIISVDDQGLYWIQNDTRNVGRMTTRSCAYRYTTFVNGERVRAVEIRRLTSGDVICLGDPDDPETRTGHGGHGHGHPVFCVKERTIGGSGSSLQINNANEACNSVVSFGDSPFTNNLILSEIMTYLPVKDLKNARQVCKKWKDEASKSLERRGKVSFSFGDFADYNPENSLRVFRYLHEMRDMKMRNLQISLHRTDVSEDSKWEWYNCLGETSPFNPLQKMMDDLRKLLNSSHSFSSLILQVEVREESDFRPFSTVFQELGGKLVELELTLDGYVQFFPKEVPPLPLLPNLRKFTQSGSEKGYYDNDIVLNKWAALLVPLFSNNLEQFICRENYEMVEPYLQAFLAQDMAKLKGIAIETTITTISDESLSFLLSLKNPLTCLKFVYFLDSEEGVRVLEKLLLKHSQSLRTLKISIINYLKNPKIRFPSFPKLGELKLEYDMRPGISWETDLDYEKHFPSLRKLTVRPLDRWGNDDPVFHAFFPEKGELRCETVKEVCIPVLSRFYYNRENIDFQPRMEKIRKMFPSAAGNINFFR